MVKVRFVLLFIIFLSFISLSCGRYSQKGDDVDNGGVENTGKIYKWVHFSTIKSFDPGVNDYFGDQYTNGGEPYRDPKYVQLSDELLVCSAVGEANDAIGVFNEIPDSYNDNCPYAGALYVYRKFGPGWKSEAYIKAPIANYSGTSTGDNCFGKSFSLQGNLILVNSNTGDEVLIGNIWFKQQGLFLCIRDENKTWRYQQTPLLTTADLPVFQWWDGTVFSREGYDFGNILLKGDRIFCAMDQRVLIYKLVQENGFYSAQFYQAIENPNPSFSPFHNSILERDSFGSSMEVSGNTLVISSTGDDSAVRGIVMGGNFEPDHSGNKNGAIYIFRDFGGGYELEACIYRPQDGLKSEYINIQKVYIEGDLLAVTCDFRKFKDLFPHSIVLVYRRYGSSWNLITTLEAAPGTNDDLTISNLHNVRISNGKIAAVSALDSVKCFRIIHGNDPIPMAGRQKNSGAIYVFAQDEGGAWIREAYIKSFYDESFDLRLGANFDFCNDVIAGSANIDLNFSGVVNSTELPHSGTPLSGSGAVQTIHYK